MGGRNVSGTGGRFSPGIAGRNISGMVGAITPESSGVAPEEEDEDFDFEETLREIHVELADLNAEAAELAAKIAKNFEGLGI